jgi:hypothetical protein
MSALGWRGTALAARSLDSPDLRNPGDQTRVALQILPPAMLVELFLKPEITLDQPLRKLFKFHHNSPWGGLSKVVVFE